MSACSYSRPRAVGSWIDRAPSPKLDGTQPRALPFVTVRQPIERELIVGPGNGGLFRCDLRCSVRSTVSPVYSRPPWRSSCRDASSSHLSSAASFACLGQVPASCIRNREPASARTLFKRVGVAAATSANVRKPAVLRTRLIAGPTPSIFVRSSPSAFAFLPDAAFVFFPAAFFFAGAVLLL